MSAPLRFLLAALVLVVAFLVAVEIRASSWREEFKAACDAHGGIARQLQDGPVCLWAGAVIPIEAAR